MITACSMTAVGDEALQFPHPLLGVAVAHAVRAPRPAERPLRGAG